MTYGSLCSGIEGASVAFRPLGWTCKFVAEVDPHCCDVLNHHYGASRPRYMPRPKDVPVKPYTGGSLPLWALSQAEHILQCRSRAAAIKAVRHLPTLTGLVNYGDIMQLDPAELPDVDVLIAGWPCQDLSVAGLRKGLAGKRSGLFRDVMRIVKAKRPQWLLFENVPGLISSAQGEDLAYVLDQIEDAGYVLDIDILDAQYFGLAQRRRRVFICAQNAESLRQQKTSSSALTIAQCFCEILLTVLVEASQASTIGLTQSDLSAGLCVPGAKRRIKLFSLDQDEHLRQWVTNCLAILVKSPSDGRRSVMAQAGPLAMESENTREGGSLVSVEQAAVAQERSSSIGKLHQQLLADLSRATKLFTTSTSIKEITSQIIFTSAQAALRIAALITQSNTSCPCFSSAALSASTALRGFINYARQTANGLFTDVEWIQPWVDFCEQAEPTCKALADLGKAADASESFSDPEYGSRYSSQSKEPWQAVAALTSNGVGTCGVDDNQAQAGHLIPVGDSGAARIDAAGSDIDELRDVRGRAFVETGQGFWNEDEKAATVRSGDRNGGGGAREATLITDDISRTVNAGGMGRIDWETETFVTEVPQALGFRACGQDGFTPSEVSPPIIDTNGGGAGVPSVLAFSCKDSGQDATEGIAPTLRAMPHDTSHANGGGQMAVAYRIHAANSNAMTSNELGIKSGDVADALASDGPGAVALSVNFRGREGGAQAELGDDVATAVRTATGGSSHSSVLAGDEDDEPKVRRLSVVETSRLQGFPDTYALVPRRPRKIEADDAEYYLSHGVECWQEEDGQWWTKVSADGPVYKSHGNSFAVPVVAWLGRRIQEVHESNS